MPTKISLPELPTLIQKLLEERQQHVDALTRIDAVLASVGAALGTTTLKPPASKTVKARGVSKVRSATGKRRRQKYAKSAEESILAFVKQNKNPTTQEIKKHWVSEGRGSSADNTLSIMVKNKKLKRTKLGKGIPGSRYSLT